MSLWRDSKIFSGSSDFPLPHTTHFASCRWVFLPGHLLITIILHELIDFLMVHFCEDFGSAENPTELVPLPDLISLTFPLRPINIRKHIMKQSVLREFAASVWIARLEKQVNNVPYHFSSWRPSFTTNGRKKSTPQ